MIKILVNFNKIILFTPHTLIHSLTLLQIPIRFLLYFSISVFVLTFPLKALRTTAEGNLLFSTPSLEVLLAMVYLGSKGNVCHEIQTALNLPNKDTTKEGYKELMGRLEKVRFIILCLVENRI